MHDSRCLGGDVRRSVGVGDDRQREPIAAIEAAGCRLQIERRDLRTRAVEIKWSAWHGKDRAHAAGRARFVRRRDRNAAKRSDRQAPAADARSRIASPGARDVIQHGGGLRIQRNSTAWFIASATAATPSPVRALVARIGRPSRTAACFRQHGVEIDAHERRQVDLVDDQQIAAQHARSALARNIIAAGDVDHEDPPIDQIEREGGREIVAAGFEDDQFDAGKSALELVAGRDIQRRIFADDGVRAGAGFDAGDPRRIDEAGAAQPLGVLLGDEIVGDDGEVDAAADQDRDQPLDQGGLAGADRSADADPRGAGGQASSREPKSRRDRAWRSPQHVALRQRQLARRLAGRQFAVDIDVEGLRVDANVRAGDRSTSCRTC